jgi:hypothetical protein
MNRTGLSLSQRLTNCNQVGAVTQSQESFPPRVPSHGLSEDSGSPELSSIGETVFAKRERRVLSEVGENSRRSPDSVSPAVEDSTNIPSQEGEEIDAVNPWGKPSSEEIGRTFLDLSKRMRRLAKSAISYQLPEMNVVSAVNPINTFGSVQSLGKGHPIWSNAAPVQRGRGQVALATLEYRTTEQRRADFGIGFMGEFFVSSIRPLV